MARRIRSHAGKRRRVCDSEPLTMWLKTKHGRLQKPIDRRYDFSPIGESIFHHVLGTVRPEMKRLAGGRPRIGAVKYAVDHLDTTDRCSRT